MRIRGLLRTRFGLILKELGMEERMVAEMVEGMA